MYDYLRETGLSDLPFDVEGVKDILISIYQFSIIVLKENECHSFVVVSESCFSMYVKCLICYVRKAVSLPSSCPLTSFPISTWHHIVPPLSPPPLTHPLLSINLLPLTLTLIPPPRSFFLFLLTQTNQPPLLPGDTEEAAGS